MSENKTTRYEYDKDLEIYNPKAKQAWLDNWYKESKKPAARETYYKIMKAASKKELDIDKDIYEFNYSECCDLFLSFKAKSLKSLNTSLTALKRYSVWALNENKTSGEVPRMLMFAKEDLIRFIYRADQFISRDELFNRVLENPTNAQDAVIPALLFEGIKGTNNCEITNLKIEDVNFDMNYINIKDENGEITRKVAISERTKDLILDAIDQEFYEKTYNPDDSNPKAKAYKLPKNEYVIRQSVRSEGKQRESGETSYKGYNGQEPVSWQIINTRVKRISKESDKLYLTTVTIFQSGMLNMLKEIEDENEELTTDDYKAVWTRFGNNEDSYFNLKELYLTSFNPESRDRIKNSLKK